MRTTHLESHLTNDELWQHYETATNSEHKKRFHMLWLIQCKNMPAIYAADHVGHNKSWGCYWVSIYNTEGPAGITAKRLRNPNIGDQKITPQIKSVLFPLFSERFPSEYGGGLWNGRKVKIYIAKRYGIEITRQLGWMLLREAGMTLQSGRPSHAKKDACLEAEFKKNFS